MKKVFAVLCLSAGAILTAGVPALAQNMNMRINAWGQMQAVPRTGSFEGCVANSYLLGYTNDARIRERCSRPDANWRRGARNAGLRPSLIDKSSAHRSSAPRQRCLGHDVHLYRQTLVLCSSHACDQMNQPERGSNRNAFTKGVRVAPTTVTPKLSLIIDSSSPSSLA